MKPKEFWINEVTGGASCAEESISNGYHLHVIEYSAYISLKAEAVKLADALEKISTYTLYTDEMQYIQPKAEQAIRQWQAFFR